MKKIVHVISSTRYKLFYSTWITLIYRLIWRNNQNLFLNSCYLIFIVYISKLICVRLFWYMHIVTLPLAFHNEKHSILHLYLIWRLVFWRLVFPRWMGIIFNFVKISAVKNLLFFILSYFINWIWSFYISVTHTQGHFLHMNNF